MYILLYNVSDDFMCMVLAVIQLMRTHMDYMERAKMLMGTDRIAEMANSPRSR